MSNKLLTQQIESKIYFLRGQKVMLDTDLAEIFGVTTSRLNEQVRRNPDRFPADFMFQLTEDEVVEIRNSSQIAMSSKKHRGASYRPNAFTEHGAVMLASVLKSPVAIAASIQVVRAFVRLRTILAEHKELAQQIEALERKVDDKFEQQDEQFKTIFKVLRELIAAPANPKKPIGFIAESK